MSAADRPLEAAPGGLTVPEAAQRLAEGGLVAFPTETVYGLGARADDAAAVAAIFVAKGRPADHPLIVHLPPPGAGQSRLEPAEPFMAEMPPAMRRQAQALAEAFWPGPLTLIVPRRAGVATDCAGGQDSIGLRMPAHPLAQALLSAAQALGVAGVAAPSANRFGRVSPTCAEHVRAEFGAAVPVLDGGECDVGIESTIVDLSRGSPSLLRPGGVPRERIEAVLGQPLAGRGADAPRASGTLEAHYAPQARLSLFGGQELRARLAALRGPAAALAVYSRSPAEAAGSSGLAGPADWVWREMPGDAESAAHELYAALRAFDAAGVQHIWVETPPAGAAWEGVRDRLQRAAAAARLEDASALRTQDAMG